MKRDELTLEGIKQFASQLSAVQVAYGLRRGSSMPSFVTTLQHGFSLLRPYFVLLGGRHPCACGVPRSEFPKSVLFNSHKPAGGALLFRGPFFILTYVFQENKLVLAAAVST